MGFRLDIVTIYLKFLDFCQQKIQNLVNAKDENGVLLTGAQKKAQLDELAETKLFELFQMFVNTPIDFVIDGIVKKAIVALLPLLTQKIFDLMKFDPQNLIPISSIEAIAKEVLE